MAQIQHLKIVSKQVDYAESDKLISFFVRESWKILNFNYVGYHYKYSQHFQFVLFSMQFVCGWLNAYQPTHY